MQGDKTKVDKCTIVRTLEILGGKWRLAIIWYLSMNKSLRYNELKRHIGGITNIMLTRSLQDLEKHGIVKRIQLKGIYNDNSRSAHCHSLVGSI